MGNNLLHSFLDMGLLNIAEDDEKFQHLQKASQEVAKKLPKKKVDIINHTLVALDPHVPPDSKPLVEAESALKKYWSTFRNRFADTPRQMLRPIIFEALRSVGESDPLYASIIWLTGGSYFPHADLGREKEVCLTFLHQMGDIAERRAVEDWTSSNEYTAPTLPDLKLKVSQTGKVTIDTEALTAHLTAAAGPTNVQGHASGKDPNQYWPNNNAHWAAGFAKRASSGISDVISQALSSLPTIINGSINQLNTGLTEYGAAINAAVGNAIDQVIQSAVVNERRNKLLWWKETLYSPTLRGSYRAFGPAPSALAMAYDLHEQVPMYCPQSLEYLLREAVREATKRETSTALSKEKLIDLIQQVILDPDVQQLKTHLGSASNIQGRKPLLGFIQGALAQEPAGPEELSEQVGVSPDTELSLEDFAAWIFRDLQAQSLATTK